MNVQLLSPEGMTKGVPYHHVAVGKGSRLVCVAGQIDRNVQGAPTAGDSLLGQVAQALHNTGTGLAGAGASFDDVVRLTFYVARWQPEDIDDFMAGVELVAGELDLPCPMPPTSLIGVEILFEPDVRVEVEAAAVLA